MSLPKIDFRADMPRKGLTDEERDAIAAFNGEVQKIPIGKSSQPEYRWFPAANGQVAEIRAVKPDGSKFTIAEVRKREKSHESNRVRAARIKAQSIAKIRQAIDEGALTASDIAGHSGLAANTVQRHCRREGIELVPAQSLTKSNRVLKAVTNEWQTVKQIAAAAGVSPGAVRCTLLRLGDKVQSRLSQGGGKEWAMAE